MDLLNEEEAMFESPLVDSYLTSPVTVSACVVFFFMPVTQRTPAGTSGGLFYMDFFLDVVRTVFHPAISPKSISVECLRGFAGCVGSGRSHHERDGRDAFLRGPGTSAGHNPEVQKTSLQR